MKKLDRRVLNQMRQRISKQTTLGIVLLCFILVVGGVFGFKSIQHQRYQKCYTKACEYYERGEYEDAILEYQKALSYHPREEASLMICLADSYIGLFDYERAAYILQEYYEKSESAEIRNKLESVVEHMIESEYRSKIERGNRYRNVGEYTKAIQEYLQAYRNKPESIEILRLLVDTYIQSQEIDSARLLLESASIHFSEDEIQQLMQQVAEADELERYADLLSEAEEFFYNESYDECFATYDKAIALFPKNIKAYEGLVNTYIDMERYEEAIEAVALYEQKYHNMELSDLKDYIVKEKELENHLNSIMKSLYDAIHGEDISSVIQIIQGEDYSKWIEEGRNYYYNAISGRRSTKVPTREGLTIYGSGYIYCGSFHNGKRTGKGFYLGLTQDILGYVLYSGEWNDDQPNGEGTLHTVMEVPYMGENQQYIVTITGTYQNGLENGEMVRSLYQDNDVFGTLTYCCINGIPQPEDSSSASFSASYNYTYSIGKLVTSEDEIDFYYITTDEKWKVPGTKGE